MKSVEYFENRIKNYKKKKSGYVAFGVKFGTEEDFSALSKEEMMLKHTVLHTCYSKYPEKIPRKEVTKFHNDCVGEMEKRGINHKEFDDLDTKGDCVG